MPDQPDNIVPFPNLIQLYLRRVALALREERLEDAIELLEEVLELDPAHLEAKQLKDSLADQLYEELELSFGSEGAQIHDEDIERWKEGLLQTNSQKQWQSFQQMHSFMDERVFELIQCFLTYSKGDLLLKTKLLQQCKLICPHSWKLDVSKLDQHTTLKLGDVPVDFEEWDARLTKPLELLEEIAYQDPSMMEMAREVWVFFLEKRFPFNDDLIEGLEEAYKWTASLHYYTLKVIQRESLQQERQKMAQWYDMTEEEIEQAEENFAELLMQLP